MGFVTAEHAWLRQRVQRGSVYNLWDVVNTAKVLGPLRAELRDNGQWDFYRREVWPLVPAVMAMQRRGLHFYPDECESIRDNLRYELHETEKTIRERAGWPGRSKPDPLNSWQKKCELLYDTLGFKVPVKRGVAVRSSDQASLDWILRNLRVKDQASVPYLHSLFHRSRLNTILTRYLRVVPDPDGRVRPTVKLYGAETGRLAYADPPIQQYPKEARGMYGPAPGRVWVAGDYSQLEARILAVLSDDRVSLDVFATPGGDVHAENAVDLLGPGCAEQRSGLVPSPARNFAKGFLYGISYGGKAETLKTKLYCPCPRCADKVPPTLDLTRADLSAASQRWFAKHAPVLRFREALSDQVRDSACYTNPLGRKRYVATPWPRCLTQVYNIPMQSTAADLINRALRRCEAEGLEVVLQMHDELVVECDPEDVPHVARRLRAAMEEPVAEMDGAVFPVDLKVGDRWDRLAKYAL